MALTNSRQFAHRSYQQSNCSRCCWQFSLHDIVPLMLNPGGVEQHQVWVVLLHLCHVQLRVYFTTDLKYTR
jgi:hypothetical protein